MSSFASPQIICAETEGFGPATSSLAVVEVTGAAVFESLPHAVRSEAIATIATAEIVSARFAIIRFPSSRPACGPATVASRSWE